MWIVLPPIIISHKMNWKKKLKSNFPKVLSDELGLCVKTKSMVSNNTISVFKQKETVMFTTLEQINMELERLEKIGVIQKKKK